MKKPIPVISLSVAEAEIKYLKDNIYKFLQTKTKTPEQKLKSETAHIWANYIVGSYCCWNYFQSINTITNDSFVFNYKKKYGMDKVTDDPMEAGYFGVYLWRNAVTNAKTSDPGIVINLFPSQSYNAPEGIVYISHNNHTWKTVKIGQIRHDGQFNIIWETNSPVRPEPFPELYSKKVWLEILKKHQKHIKFKEIEQ